MSNRFILEQKELAATLGFMQPICSKKTTMQATSLILFHVTAKELILKALKKHKGKRRDASLDLGISERTLYRKLKEYDIED